MTLYIKNKMHPVNFITKLLDIEMHTRNFNKSLKVYYKVIQPGCIGYHNDILTLKRFVTTKEGIEYKDINDNWVLIPLENIHYIMEV